MHSVTAETRSTYVSEGSRAQFALLRSELLLRFALVPCFVALCYCFRWETLRFLVSEANLKLDLLFGVTLERSGLHSVQWQGVVYHYDIACAFIDVWFGSIPLLWNLRRKPWSNVAVFVLLGLVLFTFNVLRLSFSDLLFASGLSWNLAHNVVSGIAYFLVWIWIWHHRPF
jgi:hypothetical protein